MANNKAKVGTSGNGVNKSAAIREALAAHPGAGPKEIVTLLGEKGLKVSSTLGYYIKSQANTAKRRQKRDRVAAASERTLHANPIEVVQRVKNLAREVGGIKNLKMLVDLLAE